MIHEYWMWGWWNWQVYITHGRNSSLLVPSKQQLHPVLGTSDFLYPSYTIENGLATVSSFTLLLVGVHPVVYGCELLLTALHIMSHKQYSCTQCRTHWSCTRIKQRGYSLYTDWHSLERILTIRQYKLYIFSPSVWYSSISFNRASDEPLIRAKQLSASTMPHFR